MIFPISSTHNLHALERVMLLQALIAGMLAAAAVGALSASDDAHGVLRATTGLLTVVLVGLSLRVVGSRRREANRVIAELRRQAFAAEVSQRALEASELEPLLNEVVGLVRQAVTVQHCAIVEYLGDRR